MTAPLLDIRDLSKTFAATSGEDRERVVAVDGVSLGVRAGEFFTLLGPSGCGKTTILRCIAGLERPDAGTIVVAGRVLHSSEDGIDVRANRRGLGMVFQSYAIWPHMTVRDNVAFPLTVVPRRRRPPAGEIAGRVERVLALVKLDGLAGRLATDLSGGQQQRLALARALVMEPPLLLLDEPLSNIDAKLRAEMCFELKRLQGTLGITTVYVTHDQAEALAMSSVVAVMREGRIVQTGDPQEVYSRPVSRFVAEFIGDANLIEGVVEDRRNGAWIVRTSAGLLAAQNGDLVAAGAPVVVAIRAEQIRLEPAGHGHEGNRWAGIVHTPVFRGDSVDHEIAVGDLRLRVRTDLASAAAPGERVTVALPPESCAVFAAG